MRRFLADTSAMVIFSTLLGLFVEIVLAGLDPTQSIRIRLAAIPVMLITGRPYGIYRDKLFAWFGDRRRSRFRTLAIDSIANATFQTPLYIALLAWGGASCEQMLVAAVSIIAIASVSGRPYGLFLNMWRGALGVSPVK